MHALKIAFWHARMQINMFSGILSIPRRRQIRSLQITWWSVCSTSLFDGLMRVVCTAALMPYMARYLFCTKWVYILLLYIPLEKNIYIHRLILVLFIYFRLLYELSFWVCLVIASTDMLCSPATSINALLLVLTEECTMVWVLIFVLIKKLNF